jgi:hypothetical protein
MEDIPPNLIKTSNVTNYFDHQCKVTSFAYYRLLLTTSKSNQILLHRGYASMASHSTQQRLRLDRPGTTLDVIRVLRKGNPGEELADNQLSRRDKLDVWEMPGHPSVLPMFLDTIVDYCSAEVQRYLWRAEGLTHAAEFRTMKPRQTRSTKLLA